MTLINHITLLLCLAFVPPSIAQDSLCLEHKRSGKVIYLNKALIVSITTDTDEFHIPGNVLSFKDSMFTIQSWYFKDSTRLDTTIHLNYNEVTQIEYCHRTKDSRCEKKHTYISPIILGLGITGFLVAQPVIENSITLMLIPTGFFFLGPTIGTFVNPKRYKTSKKWLIKSS